MPPQTQTSVVFAKAPRVKKKEGKQLPMAYPVIARPFRGKSEGEAIRDGRALSTTQIATLCSQ